MHRQQQPHSYLIFPDGIFYILVWDNLVKNQFLPFRITCIKWTVRTCNSTWKLGFWRYKLEMIYNLNVINSFLVDYEMITTQLLYKMINPLLNLLMIAALSFVLSALINLQLRHAGNERRSWLLNSSTSLTLSSSATSGTVVDTLTLLCLISV